MKRLLPLTFAVVAICVGWFALTSSAQSSNQAPARVSSDLLDRGVSTSSPSPRRGGTAPPTGPTPIFYPPAAPTPLVTPVPTGFGFPGLTAFGPSMGAFVGNLFLPGVPGYPASFLTLGATSGFDVTGAFAWHLAPTPMASIARVLGAAAALPPPTPAAPALIGAGFMSAIVSTGTPAPSSLVGGTAIFMPPVRVTSPAVGVFCGLAIGGPGFTPIGAGTAGNGLGGITAAPALPPIRTAMMPLALGAPVVAVSAPPAAYIAGCFADSSTTPVELQSFHID